MVDKDTIIKGCENWIKNHKGEDLILGPTAVEELLAVLKEQEAKAKWIYCEDEYGQDGYKCSECGFFVPWFYDENINFINDYKLCPSCGKTMESSAGGEADEH